MLGKKCFVLNGLLFLALLLTGCSNDNNFGVSFSRDVQPILKKYCLECHATGGKGQVASGLNMDSYGDLMKGTRFGPVIHPGDPVSSSLVALIEGRVDPSIRMPHGRDPLQPQEIRTIKTWVEQGAKLN